MLAFPVSVAPLAEDVNLTIENSKLISTTMNKFADIQCFAVHIALPRRLQTKFQ